MNTLPLFYQDCQLTPGAELELEEDTARHIVQVLRMAPGSRIALTDGRGTSATTELVHTGKKKGTVRILETVTRILPEPALHLAIAFTRHSGRNEWLLEKATELGVQRILPLQTARSDRERFKPERWQNILVAAMIQSQQYHLPVLEAPLPFSRLLEEEGYGQRLIAHCMSGIPRLPLRQAMTPGKKTLLCIGPEGDFTPEEVTLAAGRGCAGISLGTTRLRTETAAMAACAFFHLINEPTI